MASFLAELKRRNVYKVALAYAVVAWLLIQAGSILFPTFEAPSWVMKVFVTLLAFGFPVALVLAWAFELTPEGIQRTEEAVSGETGSRRGGRKFTWLIVVSALLAAGLLVYNFTRRSNAPATPEKSIAVLPLVNQSGDPGQEYFSDGLSEELINGLGQIHGLRVIGRNTSFHYKSRSIDSRALGQALGVTNLLEGSVRKAGDRVRISVALVEAASGSQRWSQTYDRELKDIFAVQEEIAKSVADQLRVALLGREIADLSAKPSNGSLEAYNAFLRARSNRSGTAEGLAKAIVFYDEAIRLDPLYAEAYALKSLTWAQIASFRGAKATDEWAKALAAADAAMAIKPDLPRARGARAYLHMVVDWDLAAAEALLAGSDRSSPSTLNMLANVRGFQGRTEEAIQLQKQAAALDPAFALFRRNLATRLMVAGRLEEAEAELRKAVDLQPQAAGIHYEMALEAVLRGQSETATREAELETNEGFRAVALALAQAAHGDGLDADAALEALIKEHGDELPFRIAGVYCYRKEPDKAFEWLERAHALHDPRLISLLADPLVRGCRSDPRFAALCRRIRLPTPE